MNRVLGNKRYMIILSNMILIKLIELKSKYILNEKIFSILHNLLFFLFLTYIKYKYKKNKCSNKSIILHIFSLFNILILSESKKLNFNTEITITIQGPGTQQILSDSSGELCSLNTVNFMYVPDQLYINGEPGLV